MELSGFAYVIGCYFICIAKHTKLIEKEKSGLNQRDILTIQQIIDAYSKVLELSPKQKSAFLNRGIAKTSLAKIYMEEDRDDEALELFDSSVGDFGRVIYIDDKNIDAYLYSAISNHKIHEIYKQKLNYDFARRYLFYIMEDYNTLLRLVDKNYINTVISEKALIEFDLAEIYLLLNKSAKALEHFQNSIDNYLQNIDEEATFNIVLAYSNMASICQESGERLTHLKEYNGAIEEYNNSIKYLNKLLVIEPSDKESLGNIPSSQSDIAKLYLLLGQNREAIEFYNQAINGLLNFLSHYPNSIISLNTLAVSYTELANIHRYEMIQEQDESIMKRVNKAYLESIKYYKQALKIDKDDTPTSINLAGNYSELGMFYIYIKENKNAIESCKKSLETLSKVYGIGGFNPEQEKLESNINITKLYLAKAYKQDAQKEKALEVLESVLEESNKDIATIQAEIGRLYLDKELDAKAIEFFDRAIDSYDQELKEKYYTIIILENLSLLFESILKISNRADYIDRAIECNQKIIEIYDNYFVDIGFENDAFSITQKMSVALHRLLDAYVVSDREVDISLVEILERVKAKRLKQLIIANRFDSEDIEVNQLKNKIDIVKRAIAKESINMFNIEKKERLYEEFQEYSQELSKILNLQEDELDIFENLTPKMVVVYPIYSREKLTIVTIIKKDKVEINISQTVIKEDIRFSDYLFFIKYIEGSINNDKFLDKEYLKIIDNIKIDKRIKKEISKIDEDEFIEYYKYEIVQIALSHIKDEIINSIPSEVEKILFAPFGDLNLIPLHAISTGEDKYLIEDYEISYIASLSLIKKIELNPKTDRVTSEDNLIISMEGLHNEAKNVLKSIKGEHLKEIETDEFKEYLEDKSFNILHFSTHGSASLDYPLDSHLEFNKTNLHLLEIFGLNIDANLVNISACETYLSKLKGADEVLAFERAFLIAGAKSVISTFSKVDIMRTEDFMENFYTSFKKSGFISKSFQKASIEDIENGSMEWSLFRLMGSY